MDAAPTPSVRTPLLERLALHRPELRAWALYDWANSAFFTTVVAAVFPVYYQKVAAAGRDDVLETYSGVTSAAMLVIAVLGPLLGALADTGARKKPFLLAFLVLGCLATAGLYFVERGDWVLACVLFAVGNVGVAGSFVFYDALLPAVARPDELDRVSSAGYALGYLGGGTLLGLNLLGILHPHWFGLEPDSTLPTRLSFVSVAVWWALFSIPLFRRVPEPPRAFESDEAAGDSVVRTALTRLGETLREVRGYRQVFLMLLAMLVYSDGINTVIRMAVVYGGRLGIAGEAMIPAVLCVQFLGVPCAFGFGWLAGRLGPKRAILLGLAVYVGIVLYAAQMDSEFDFYVVAAGVGLVQGGCQALSRSLFASMVPAHKAGEFFGLFGVLERFANVLGPLAFTLAIAWTGNERAGLLPLILFFAVGALLLSRVDVEEGRRIARERTARG
ncbi:MAG: MFS transporter [Planctomycetes bacterium]|nr:MFS transporter [Planctomycetota bacterium]